MMKVDKRKSDRDDDADIHSHRDKEITERRTSDDRQTEESVPVRES